jgi:hypothetical protein
MFVVHVWLGVAGGKAAIARISDPALGVSRAMARYGWYGGGIQRGFIIE